MADEQQDNTFPAMINARFQGWKKNFDDNHFGRVEDYYTLAMRNKGQYFGAMSTKVRGKWNGRLGKGLVTFPVVPRAIRSKTATAISTDIRLDFKSSVPLPEKEAGVQMAENIYQFLEGLYWTEPLEISIAQLGMFGGFMGVRAEIDDDGPQVGSRQVTGQKWLQRGYTTFGCTDCGGIFEPQEIGLEPLPADMMTSDEDVAERNGEATKSGEPAPYAEPADVLDAEIIDDGPPKPTILKYSVEGVKCPRCDKPTLTQNTEEDYELGEAPTGELERIMAARFEMNAVPALLIRFDDLSTIGFKWEKAHWFNYHPPRPVYELLARRPKLKEKLAKNRYSDWSDSTKLYYDLSNSKGGVAGSTYENSDYLDSYAESDYWHVQPVACKGWKEPVGWTLFEDGTHGAFGETRPDMLGDKGGDLDVVFDIDAGETIEAAFKRREPEEKFRGTMVEMWGEEVVDVRNESFQDFWTLFGWQIDAAAAIPMGEERLNNLQDACTNVLSMIYSYVLRASNPKGVYDGRFFDENQLTDNQPGQWLRTKQDIQTDENYDVMKKIGYLSPADMSSVVDMFVQLIIQISKEESGVFDETVGNVNPQNQTKGGRELAVNQSLSLMTPSQKAKKYGKIAWARMMLNLWQRYMPDEAYKLVKGTYEDEWKPQDIEQFKALDVDREIQIDAIEGTDIPRTRSEYEQRFLAAMNFGLFDSANPVPLDIRVKVIKTLGLTDVDLDNYDADRRLAARRKDVMNEILDDAAKAAGGYDKLIAIVPDPATITPATPAGLPKRVLVPDVKLMIAQDPRTKVCQEDNHLTFIGYYTDQLKGLRGSKQPREPEIMLLEDAIDAHRAMIAASTAQVASVEGVIGNAGADQAGMGLAGQKDDAAKAAEAAANQPPPQQPMGVM